MQLRKPDGDAISEQPEQVGVVQRAEQRLGERARHLGRVPGSLDRHRETIKRVNSSLDVIVGGLGGTRELEFLDYLVANLTATPTSVPASILPGDLFSGIAFHPYSSPPEELAKKLSEYDEILSRYQWTIEDGARHWITEIGSETDSPRDGPAGSGRSAAGVRRDDAKQMAIATSWGVEGSTSGHIGISNHPVHI